MSLEEFMEMIYARGFGCVKVHCHFGRYQAKACNEEGEGHAHIFSEGATLIEALIQLNERTEETWRASQMFN